IADLKNNAVRRIQNGPQQPPVPTPEIGWVDYIRNQFDDIVSVLRTNQPFVFNNDVTIAIKGTDGTQTHFTYGVTPSDPLNDTIPNPSATVGSTPPPYRDGLFAFQVPASIINPEPDQTVKAMGFAVGRQSSGISSARFQFKTGTPIISGNNAAQFNVRNFTALAKMWYTADGTEPTNAPPSIGPISSPATLSIIAYSNVTFKIRAFRDHYTPSDVAVQVFNFTNFNA